LAVAAIQTVEVRERFSDGIAWIKLGRKALTEKDIRILYEDIYDQLFSKPEKGAKETAGLADSNFSAPSAKNDTKKIEPKNELGLLPTISPIAHKNRNRFQFGELEGIREDLSEMICSKKILLCLDDVWRAEDACWFLFVQRDFNGKLKRKRREAQKENEENNAEPLKPEHNFKVLITTRFPALLGPGMSQEVFVRILTEHEAVKLFISASGKRAQGGKNSALVTEAKTVVKGCGNSPLAIRVAGGLLGVNNRWTLSSTAWKMLLAQSKSCLTEATQLRSFSKAFGRIVDLCFSSIEDSNERAVLRRCFVMFAVIFDTDPCTKWGRYIPENVILSLFSMIQSFKPSMSDNHDTSFSSSQILSTLEKMNLLERTRVSLFLTDADDQKKAAVEEERKELRYACYFMHDAVSGS
jgi:hypothetical protein